MRVAHVLGGSHFGGVETMALRLVRSLPSDHEHLMVFTGPAGARHAEFASEPRLRLRTCEYAPPARRDFVRRFVDVCREERPDVLLAYSFGNHAMISYAAKRAGVPRVLVRVAGSPARDLRTRWKATLLAQAARPFCDGEIAVSESVRGELVRKLGIPARRVITIPNGCEVRAIRERARAAPRGSPPRIVMVSRMDDAKDHATALRAFALVRDQVPDHRLELVGDGPYRGRHEALARELGIADSVDLLGNRRDAIERMAGAVALVHATHTEGFPNVLIEAMAAGVPIVATDIAPCREVLDGGRCGTLVPPREPRALADALIEVIKGRASHVDAAARRVESEYDITVCAQRYAEALSAGKGRGGARP